MPESKEPKWAVQPSNRVAHFTESVIREMTRLCEIYGGINLAQGFPDFPAPKEIKEAAIDAVNKDFNQYTITWGSQTLRTAIAKKLYEYNGIEANPEENIVITCGSTEAMMATMLALVNPGDEVIIFEPFYENYGPDAAVSGATPRFVQLETPSFEFDEEKLKEAFTAKTKAIIINTPNNPTGKVFTSDQLNLIGDLCEDYNALAVTDEIYEYIIYNGRKHISMASIGDMAHRTVTISGFSKTYSITGWRLGYAVAEKKIMDNIRKVHDFLTVGAPAPLQEAAVRALSLPSSYYDFLKSMYDKKRKFMLGILQEIGLTCYAPEGAYYIMADFGGLGFNNDVKFAEYLVKEIRVGVVPGSSFYFNQEKGRRKIRFTFSKSDNTLREAAERLSKLSKN